MALPQLLFYDQDAYNREVDRHSSQTVRFQAIVDAFVACGAPAPLTSADFDDLLRHPKDLLWRKLNNGTTPTLNGLPVKSDQAWQLVEATSPMRAYFAAAQAVQDINLDATAWELTNDGTTLSLRADYLTSLQGMYKVYAVNQRQLDHWNAFTAFADALNTLRTTHYANSNIDWLTMVRRLMVFPNDPYNSIKVNPKHISHPLG